MSVEIEPRADYANIGSRLSTVATLRPDAVAVAMPKRNDVRGRRKYRTLTFAELERDSNTLAAGMQRLGIGPGQRIVLMVPPSVEFISLTFALFKVGAIVVLIDPGMGRANLVRCLQDVEPDGFVAIPLVQAIRVLLRGRVPKARMNVTVGRRWFWGGATVEHLRRGGSTEFQCASTGRTDPAAIIFTTGSTGPPKGVLYRHGNFDCQVRQIRDRYSIQPGEVDLPGFPLFGLFNAAMGVTTVIPDMNPTRPARVDPKKIVEGIEDWQVTQAFGSPAMWNAVGQYCEKTDTRLPTLRRVLSAGAPVPHHVLQRMKSAIADDGEIHTPYGATEALPVASISGSEVLGETRQKSDQGAGTCVGTAFSEIQWKVIEINDTPIASIEQAEELPAGQIGELIVRGSVVTTEYVTRGQAGVFTRPADENSTATEIREPNALASGAVMTAHSGRVPDVSAFGSGKSSSAGRLKTNPNALAKIHDTDGFWHRMGDVGYLDEEGRFWFCGRKAHRVVTRDGPMYTVCCEAILNQHEDVYRSALVGVGPHGQQTPVVVVETWPERRPKSKAQRNRLLDELSQLAASSSLTSRIPRQHILLHPSLPVDIRHNAKIFREKLAVWAGEQLRRL